MKNTFIKSHLHRMRDAEVSFMGFARDITLPSKGIHSWSLFEEQHTDCLKNADDNGSITATMNGPRSVIANIGIVFGDGGRSFKHALMDIEELSHQHTMGRKSSMEEYEVGSYAEQNITMRIKWKTTKK